MNNNSHITLFRNLLMAILLMGATFANQALAQQSTPQTAPGLKMPATPSVAQAAQPTEIATAQAIYLVRTTLLSLNDANRSGNYSVLRDLAAPDFQAKNSAADLAQSFADLRRRNFDLFAAALIAPQFTGPAALDANGRVHLTGFFPTRPLQISFDLMFQPVNGQWRLLAISVATPSATTQQAQLAGPPKRHTPQPIYGFRLFAGTAGLRW